MKTQMKFGLIRASLIFLSVICVFEIISELEYFSQFGHKGILMNTVGIITRPAGDLFETPGVKPVNTGDLDFPPQPDSLSENKTMYADSAVNL